MNTSSNRPEDEGKDDPNAIANAKLINQIENVLDGSVQKQVDNQHSVDQIIKVLQRQVQSFQGHISTLNDQIRQLKDQKEFQNDRMQEVRNAQSDLTNFSKMIQNTKQIYVVSNEKAKNNYPIPSPKANLQDDENLLEQEIPQKNEAFDIMQNNQYMMQQHHEQDNVKQENTQNFEMLNPIMPPVAKINHKKNAWAVKRLDNCFPKFERSHVRKNIQGKLYVEKDLGNPGIIIFAYLYFLPLTLSIASFYECFGICCCLRKQFLEGVDIVMSKEVSTADPIFFSEKSIKRLRLYYEIGSKLKLNLTKFKKLMELSIQADDATGEFNAALGDEFKACQNILKLTLDIQSLQSHHIQTVIGYMQQLQSLSIRIKDNFDFNSIEYNLPKLKELNTYNQSLDSLARISNKIKELLVLRLHQKDDNTIHLSNILENLHKNAVPLRQLSLILTSGASSLNSAFEQIGQITSLQIMEIQKEGSNLGLANLDVSKLKNLEILYIKGFTMTVQNLQQCHHLKTLHFLDSVQLQSFAACSTNLSKLTDMFVEIGASKIDELSSGLQHAQNLEVLEISTGMVYDKNIDSLGQALADKRNLKWFIMKTSVLSISDNSLIKLTSSLLSDKCQLQRFSLNGGSMSEITGQSFEMFFQAVAAVKSLLIFDIDIKNNNNITEQSIQEVTSAIKKIKSNVKIYEIAIESLGRVKADILSKLSGAIIRSISAKDKYIKVLKEYAQKLNRREGAMTIFDTIYKY